MRVQNNGDADDPYVAIDYDEWVAAGREEEQGCNSIEIFSAQKHTQKLAQVMFIIFTNV